MRLAPARLRLLSISVPCLISVLCLAPNIAPLLAIPARPQPLPVVRYVNATAQLGGDGTSWGSAYNSLDYGIQHAPVGAEIWVAASTTHYVPPRAGFIINNDINIYGGFNGTELSLADRIGDFMGTVLDGNSFADHVFKIGANGSSPSVVIDGFLITGGVANGPAPDNDGAGIYCHFSNLELANCFVQNNHADHDGGGLFIEGNENPITEYTLHMKRCEFNNNSASNNGGAVFDSRARGYIVNCSFLQNVADSHGGAVYNWHLAYGQGGSFSTLAFTNTVFQLNHATTSASKGGAVCLDEDYSSGSPAGSARFVNCTFAQNYLDTTSSFNQNGEVLNVSTNSVCSITNSILWFNYTQPPLSPIALQIAGAVSIVSVDWSDYEGGWTAGLGANNISGDPLFKSLAIGWLKLTGPNPSLGLAGSPCIDHADFTKLPNDYLDIDDDGSVVEKVDLDLTDWYRWIDLPGVPNLGAPPLPPNINYLDMGAYETRY